MDTNCSDPDDPLNITSLLGKNVTVSFKRAPMDRNLWVIIFKLLCIVTGIPLNMLLSIAILRLRRFRMKPRNLFLIGIIVSDLTAFIPPSIEAVDYFFIYPPESGRRTGGSLVSCLFYVVTRSLPEVFLLINILFSLIDRYISIHNHLWHRSRVTSCKVITAIVCAFVLSTILLRFHYISGLIPLRCQGEFWSGFPTAVVLLTLFVLCIIFQILVYVQSRKLLFQLHPPRRNDHEAIQLTPFPPAEEPAALNSNRGNSDAETGTGSNFNKVNPRRLRRLEEESTRALLIEVATLLVLFCPTAVYLLWINLCRLLSSNVDLSCNSFNWLNSYFKMPGLIHAVYHPALVLFQHEEFSTVFKITRTMLPAAARSRRP